MRAYLQRLDADVGMARFYTVAIVPTLFGWSVVTEWGRIGQGGTVREEAVGAEAEAVVVAEAHVARKQRRGYRHRLPGLHRLSAYDPT